MNPIRQEHGRRWPARRRWQHAVVATLLCGTLGSNLAAAGDDLGRLFFTPERRAGLERQRGLNLPQQESLGDNGSLTLNGIVTRSSGKRTIWVNGTALSEDSSTVRFRVAPGRPGAAHLATGEARPATMVVGSTLNRNSGTVGSSLGDGWVRVNER